MEFSRGKRVKHVVTGMKGVILASQGGEDKYLVKLDSGEVVWWSEESVLPTK